MRDIIYRLADGRLWQASRAAFISEVAAASPGDDDGGQDFHVIDLKSAEGRSDEFYLAETLHACGWPLGELLEYSASAIKEELASLDRIYLTPRVLACLAQGGDPIAQAQWLAHEVKAGPLRQKLRELEGEPEDEPANGPESGEE